MSKSRASGLEAGPRVGARILLVLSVLVVVLMITLYRLRIIGPEGMGLFFIPVFALSTVASILYWRSLDEPSREAHKFAVFWGLGFAFAFVGLIGCEMLFFRAARDLVQGWVEGWIAFSNGKFGEQQGAVGFYLGILASTILLGLGYVLVWVGWWGRQRVGTKAD